MDNFKAVYKILSSLEAQMDLEQTNIEMISPTALKVSDERWCRYIEMMSDVGYIKGVEMYDDITGERHIEADRMRITLKGLEYLQENTIMQRMYKLAKGIKDVTPGL